MTKKLNRGSYCYGESMIKQIKRILTSQSNRKNVIITMMVGSAIGFLFDASFGIYIAVMTNVMNNYYIHYTTTYVD